MHVGGVDGIAILRGEHSGDLGGVDGIVILEDG